MFWPVTLWAVVFWAGVALTCAGVGEHLRMFAAAAPGDFTWSMTPLGPVMLVAMATLTIGVVVSGFARAPVGRTGGAGIVPAGAIPAGAVVSRRRRPVDGIDDALSAEWLKRARALEG
ncbi:hypothetical protein AB0M87_26145 [Streptomyces sp. NPDC051320]|uniref:hypothetical protein n=1 Tax=Streptomyces sp. NPDC051320 TaxID=3154644 RepID=UPI00342ED209